MTGHPWAAWTLLALTILSFGANCHWHGKPKTGNHSLWSWMFAAAVWFYLHFNAGTFACIGWAP